MGGPSRFTDAQVTRGRQLVQQDAATRVELGDLLLEVAPWRDEDTDVGEVIAEFANAIGLATSTARQYRQVAAGYDRTLRQQLADLGVAATFSAIRTAVLSRPHYNQDADPSTLIAAARVAADDDRDRITEADVRVVHEKVFAAEQRRLQGRLAKLRKTPVSVPENTPKDQPEDPRTAQERMLEAARTYDLAGYSTALKAFLAEHDDDVVETLSKLRADTDNTPLNARTPADELADLAGLGEVDTKRFVERETTLDELRDCFGRLRHAAATAERTIREKPRVPVPGYVLDELRSLHEHAARNVTSVGEWLRDA